MPGFAVPLFGPKCVPLNFVFQWRVAAFWHLLYWMRKAAGRSRCIHEHGSNFNRALGGNMCLDGELYTAAFNPISHTVFITKKRRHEHTQIILHLSSHSHYFCVEAPSGRNLCPFLVWRMLGFNCSRERLQLVLSICQTLSALVANVFSELGGTAVGFTNHFISFDCSGLWRKDICKHQKFVLY